MRMRVDVTVRVNLAVVLDCHICRSAAYLDSCEATLWPVALFHETERLLLSNVLQKCVK